jgi:trk system potassium uptake protein TrkA
MRSFVILGAGRFGQSIAKTLCELGRQVLVIDKDEEIIQNISDFVTHAVVGDVTDEHVLRALGARNFDVAVVTIGESMESSILVTMLMKEMGIKYILAKAQNDLHAKILSKIGADRVIFPERDMGIRVAHNLVSTNNILDYIELSSDYSIVEIIAPEYWENKTLKELSIRTKYHINVMAIKSGKDINIMPKADDVIRHGDVLVVIASDDALNRLEKK